MQIACCLRSFRLLVILGVLVTAGLACRLGASQPTKPTVVITLPQSGSSITVGQEIIVQSMAVDAKGVARVEYFINGELINSQAVNPPSTSFTANQAWSPEVPGRQIIEARAYNVDEEVSEPAQVVVTISEGAARPVAAGNETLQASSSGQESPVPGAPGEAAAGGPMVTALVNLNIRSGPGVEYPAVGALLAGQSAPISGVSAEGGWWQVIYQPGAAPGWVSGSSKYSTSDHTEGVPVVEAPPPPTPTPTLTPTPTSTATPTVTPTPPRVVTYGLVADKDAILVGESVVLRWNLRDVKTGYLLYNGLEEKVVVPDNKTFYPVKTTTYTLVTRDDAGEDTVVAQLTIKVNNATATPIPVLRDGKTRIADGQRIDFDQGIVYQEEAAGVDFSWNGQAKKFVPQGGSAAALLELPFDEIMPVDCRLAAYRGSMPESAGDGEVTGCYRTGDGRYGKFWASEWDSNGNLTLQWLTWDYR